MERIVYARVCVEVDAFQPLINSVEMVTPTDMFHQPIEYDWKPHFCNHCLRFGHAFEDCRKEVKTKEQENEFQEKPKKGEEIE